MQEDIFTDKDYPEVKYNYNMDEKPLELTLADFFEKVEVTDFGKLQLLQARDAAIEAKAYNGLKLQNGNLYHDVAMEGYLRGVLTAIDLIADHVKVPSSQDDQS